ncbi:hypothetical protein L596_030385 [Steinernema carpocapsae]|uniref:Uncharacterized protein n=1 Tax=Steinernema carpocapsae TaxID=34508 RepID=A0A4U5LPA1_STECR|nr:hypothetical protein L596_030385 [Steinernema carpocapsae]
MCQNAELSQDVANFFSSACKGCVLISMPDFRTEGYGHHKKDNALLSNNSLVKFYLFCKTALREKTLISSRTCIQILFVKVYIELK